MLSILASACNIARKRISKEWRCGTRMKIPSLVVTLVFTRCALARVQTAVPPVVTGAKPAAVDKSAIGRITFWGVTDGDSWLNNFPTRGRTNYPLLFDRQGKPKPAFDAVVSTAKRPNR